MTFESLQPGLRGEVRLMVAEEHTAQHLGSGGVRVLATPQMVYHPQRLRYPLKRTGERGEGKWQRLSWEQAFTEISAAMLELGQRYGPDSIAWMTPVLPNLTWGGYSRLASLTKGTVVDW